MNERRSRRRVLFGGLAAAAAAVLGRAARPEPAAAANGDPVIAGGTTAASTSTQVATTDGAGVLGRTDSHAYAGVAGLVGSGTGLPDRTIDAGVFGLGGGTDPFTAGVWGDTSDGVGVIGTGAWGVYGTGGVAVAGDAGPGATGVYGFVGNTTAPLPMANVGVEARSSSSSYLALNVVGKAVFSRSGRIRFNAGQNSVTVRLSGVSRASLILCTPQTYQSGVWVTVAAPFTNQFVVRLSKAPTITYYVSFLVLN